MSEYWITLDGHNVPVVEDGKRVMLTLPCLGGEGANRASNRITVEFEQGYKIGESSTGGSVEVSDGGRLVGWGEIDTDDAVCLQSDVAAWYVEMPRSLWTAAEAWGNAKAEQLSSLNRKIDRALAG